MDMVITLIVYICIIAILFWLVNKIPIPEPFVYVAYAIMAIVAIALLLSLVGYVPWRVR